MWNMFKVNNKDTRRHWRRSGLFIVNFEHILHLVLVFLLLTLNIQLLAGIQMVKKCPSVPVCANVLKLKALEFAKELSLETLRFQMAGGTDEKTIQCQFKMWRKYKWILRKCVNWVNILFHFSSRRGWACCSPKR